MPLSAWVGVCLLLSFVLSDTQREPLVEVACGPELLRVVYARDVNHCEGVTTNRRLVGEWVGEEMLELAIDGGPLPTALPESRWPPSTRRGEGAAHVHFFLDPARFDVERAARVERCAEQHAAAILAAIDRQDTGTPGAPGRARVYWRAAPEALVAELRDGDRVLSVQRDGVVTLDERGSGAWVGQVDRVDGARRFRCCAQMSHEELPRFRTPAGEAITDVLEVELTPGFDYDVD